MGSMLLAVDPSKSSKKMRTTPNPFRRLRHPAISPPSPRIRCPIRGRGTAFRWGGARTGVSGQRTTPSGHKYRYSRVQGGHCHSLMRTSSGRMGKQLWVSCLHSAGRLSGSQERIADVKLRGSAPTALIPCVTRGLDAFSLSLSRR